MSVLATAASTAAPTQVRYRVLAWVCSLSMLTYVDRVCIKQVAGRMSEDLGLTPQQFGWVFAAFGLSYALFEIPSGWLGDRLGPRKVLVRIVLWWSLFTALTGCVWPFVLDTGLALPLPPALTSWFTGTTAPAALPLVVNSLMLLLAIRFLFGAGEAGAYPNIARALRSWFPYARRGLAQGLLWMSGRWGGAAAPSLVFLASLPFGWRGAFVLFGVVGVLWATAFAQRFRNTPAEDPGVNDAERALILGDARESTRPPPLSWRTMLTSRTLWLLSAMYFCSNAGWCFFITWDAKYYAEVLRLDGAALRLASSAPLFFGGIACVLGGFVTDRQVRRWGRRWGRTLQGFLAYLLGATFFLLALAAPGAVLPVALLCLASFVKDFAMSVSWATCIDIGQRYSGTVAGFMNMVGNLGTFVAPPVVAYLARRGQWGTALAFSGAMFFLAAVCWLFINPRHVVVYDRRARRSLWLAPAPSKS